ncbi:MAG: 2-oxo acid dehydrogenase subunit E2 [Actinobacteria bacterium]|nr:MAG: 2-oxo acid dehydrogenase subunit E2 [Actinomycetota bacterium]
MIAMTDGAVSPAGVLEYRLGRLGRAMAKSMATATSTAALSQVTKQIDLGSVVEDRESLDDPVSVNTYVLAAVAACLGRHPMLNGRLEDKTVITPDAVNLGVAVAVDEGLLVPIVHSADQLGFDQLDEAVNAIAAKARSNELVFADIDGGTFTVSNLGMYGIDGGFAIPPPPQGAILLVGRAKKAFVPAEDDSPEVRTLAWFGLTFDHRFIDGATAAALLTDINKALADARGLRATAGTAA